MPLINHASREVTCKIVYYGPGLGGKTANLEHIHARLSPEARGTLISLAAETDRTRLFDLLPVDLGTVRGFRTRFHLLTVPGDPYFGLTRKLVLREADGIVFVADSRAERSEANVESLDDLRANLAGQGRKLARTPLVMQYNKRDLPGALPVAEMDADLNPRGAPAFLAVGSSGPGVFDSLKAVARMVVRSLN